MAASLLAVSSASAADPQRLSSHRIGESKKWQGYDEAPAQALVHPVRVLEGVGEVSDPQALSQPASGETTTLTYSPGGTQPSLILDYGKDVGGTATFDVSATSGTTIEATYSETLANMGNDGASTVGPFQSGNAERHESFPVLTPGAATASLIQGGERYEKVTLTAPGSVTLRSAGINFTPLRATPSVMPGHFYSSDELLNRIWYAGAYTLNLNQMTPGTTVQVGGVNQLHLIMDGAKRDRAVWSGDHLVSDLTDYYASDPVYVRESLALFLEHPATEATAATPALGEMSQPGPLPGACTPNPNLDNDGCVTWSASYSMMVMSALYNYYLYTGDLNFVQQHWQAVVRQMQWDAKQVDSNGLFAVTNDGANWNVDVTTGELTYVNAVYVQALRSAAKLAAAIGQGAEASEWSTQAVAIKNAVNAQLWNPETHVYDASTSERGFVVQDANVTAILAGIPSPSQTREILAVLPRALASEFGPLNVSSPAPSGYKQDISPYIGSFDVLADFASGDEAAALALIRQEWGFMINNDPGGVDWERIQLNGIPAGGPIADSAAHAWSTGPTAAMSQYVLGVTPADPGFAEWAVAPCPGDLKWAQGVVPTPHGGIVSRWKRGARNSWFRLTAGGATGTTGTVAVPLLGSERTIWRDGEIVWQAGVPVGAGASAVREGDYVRFPAQSDVHTFAWAR